MYFHKIKYISFQWTGRGPYTGENLIRQGASSIVAHEAFKAAGYELHIEFYPWTKAIDYAGKSAKFVGYFPEYYSRDIEAGFIFSDPIETSPLGFTELKDAPVKIA